MITSDYEMDEIDKQIVELIQQDPGLTHSSIAEKIHRSQPTVGSRIKKLENSGILQFQAGLNMKNIDYYFAKVELQTLNPVRLIELINRCPYLIHGFKTSGDMNFLIIIANQNFKALDRIVNYHFRNDPDIINVKVEIITEIINDFVVPVYLETGYCSCAEDHNQRKIRHHEVK
jgi:Lrp/AsnC family transcriptional regulator